MNAHYLTTILNLYIYIRKVGRMIAIHSKLQVTEILLRSLGKSQRERDIMQFGSKGNIKLRLRERASERGR